MMFCCCRDKPANSGGGDVPLPPPKDGKGEKIDTRQFTDAPITHPVETQPIRIGPESTEKREALEISAKSQQSGRLVKEVKEEAVAKTVASSQSVAPSQTQSQNSSQARRPQQSQSPSQSESDMKHQTVINVGGSNPGVVNPSSPPEPSQAMTETERTILSEIDKLAGAVDSVEGAAAMSRADAKKCASVYANQLVALTSQVRKEAEKMSEAGLQTAVERLEKVAARLETLASQSGRSAGGGDTDEVNPFVTAFDDLVGAAFAKYVSCSAAIGGDVKKQADLVEAAFREQRQFLVVASKSKAPSQDAMMSVVKPMAAKIQAVVDFRENNRRSEFFNHLSAISESIAAFGWIAVSPAPGPYVKEMMDSGTFYTNRVLKDYKEKDPKHVEWVKSWLAVLNPLQDYIKEFHRTGVTWNPKGGDALSASASSPPAAAAGVPPPPPPGAPPPPPPPPPADLSAGASAGGGGSDARAALFADLNKGTAVTSGLKKVTDDMKTHKNPALRAGHDTGVRQGPAPFKATAPKPVAAPKPGKPAEPAAKPPVTELQNKKWIVEYHKGNKNIVLDNTELKQTVYVYKCTDCVIQVKGKVNSITLDQCKKTAIVFEDLVSSLEFVNCQSMQGQVLGRVPTISIDKTDGCMVYLSENSLDTEIVSAKSSEMNVLVPQGGGDFKEFALPEQFKTKWNGKAMVTEQTDL